MQLGSTVTLHYVGTLEDGTEFGRTTPDNPMTFQTGMDLVINGLEKEILAMNEIGEKKTFTVNQYEAYGEYLEDQFTEVPRQLIPRDLQVGQVIPMANEEGEQFLATVVQKSSEKIKFDLNHPLAGKDLTFAVEIIDIEDAPENFIPMEERRKMMEENRPSQVPFE